MVRFMTSSPPFDLRLPKMQKRDLGPEPGASTETVEEEYSAEFGGPPLLRLAVQTIHLYGYLSEREYPLISCAKQHARFPSFLERGGLVQTTSLRGGSRTRLALSYLEARFAPSGAESRASDPPSSAFFLWVADEGVLYAEALHERWHIPLYRLLLVKVPDPQEVWRVGLEAVQTGLFGWVFLRASRACGTAHLRKLQLCAEKASCRVFLLNETKLPHWTLKASLEAGDETNPLSEELEGHGSARRSLLSAEPPSIRAGSS